MPLNDLEEQCRPILHRLGEDLQHVALVVAVDQDAQFGQFLHVLVDLADALRQHLVIRLRHAQERHVVGPQRLDRLDDVAGRQGDVLHAGSVVEVQVLLDLRASFRLRRLVDRELDPPRAVADHLGHEGRVVGADVLVVEADDLLEAHHVLVELHPLVHLAFLDVADDVIDGNQAGSAEGALAVALGIDRLVAGGEHALVVVAVDEGVRGVAVGLDGGVVVDAVLVLDALRRRDGDGAALAGLAPGEVDVVDLERDVLHAIAVQQQPAVVRVAGRQRRDDVEGDVALAEDVAGLLA